MKNSLLLKSLPVLLPLSISLFVSVPVFSQVSLQWEKFYGNSKQNDQVRGMVADDEGNVYITGISAGINNKSDYVTIKYNTSGVEQWVARYNGFDGNDEAQAIAIDKSGNIYVTGYSEKSSGSYDFATVKYNNAGIQQWVTSFNGPDNGLDLARAIKLDKDGNVYVCGFATVQGSPDCAVVKYNSSGVLQWARYYNGSGDGSDVVIAMALDPVTSDVYVTGTTTSANSNDDWITIKYNSAGIEQWTRTYNGPANSVDDGRLIVLDPQGNVYVSGFSRAPGNVYDCAIIKYGPSGTQQWIATYSGPANKIVQPNGMVADKSGNIYITGFTLNAQNKYLCVTFKYNSVGIQQWVQFYSAIPGGDNIGWAIVLDNQDNIYVAGQGSGSNSFSDYITIKYNPDGVLQWAEQNNFSNLISVPSAIAVNKFNNVFVTGSVRTYADITADYYDYATIKYVQSTPLSVKAILDTIVYYGYGSNCVQLKAEAFGGIKPYIFSWSPGGTTPNNQSTTVCPTKTSVYTVTAIDGKGTTATALVTVKVIDVRCGEKKILVCHNNKDLCVAASAVPAHLQHGDRLGSCSDDIKNGNNPKDVSNSKEISAFTFKAYPNPFRDVSNIIYQLPLDAHVVISLLDLNGRELATITQGKKRAGYYLVPINAEKLPSGVYLCRIIVGISPSQSIHLIKLVVAK